MKTNETNTYATCCFGVCITCAHLFTLEIFRRPTTTQFEGLVVEAVAVDNVKPLIGNSTQVELVWLTER